MATKLHNSNFKTLRLVYRSQIPDSFFDKYCMKQRVSRNVAIQQLKSAAAKAADDAINFLLMEVQDVHEIYDNGE